MKRIKKLVTAIAVMGFVNCYGYAADLNSQSMNARQTVSTAVAQLGKGVPVMASTYSKGYDVWYGSMFIMSDGFMYIVDDNWNILYVQNVKDYSGYPQEKGVPVAGFIQPGYSENDIYQYHIFYDGSMYKSSPFYDMDWADTQKNIYDMEGYPIAKGIPVAAFEWTKASNSFRMIILADGSVYRFMEDWVFEPDPDLPGANIKNAPDYPKDKGVPIAAYQSPNKQSDEIYFIFADGSHYRIGVDSTEWKFEATVPASIYEEKGYPKLDVGLQVELSLEHDLSLLGGTYKIYNNSKNQARLKVKASVYSENEYYERTYYDFDINELMGALTLYDQQDIMKPQLFSLQRNEYILGSFNETRLISSTVELGELVNYELKAADKIEKSGYIYFTSAAEQYQLYNLCVKYMEDQDRSNGGTCNKQTVLVEGKVPLEFSRSSFEWQLNWRWNDTVTYTENIYRLIGNSVKIRSIYNANASDNGEKAYAPKQKFQYGTTGFKLLGGSKNPGKIILEKNEVSIYNYMLSDKKGCYDQHSPLIIEDEYGNTSKVDIDFGYGDLYTWVMEQGKPLSEYRCLNIWS
ncbi:MULTISPECIES: hypothetical protein [Cysteiniphilum]|uniref:Uncharacterized protein n=1 Tax=Cysteiniphilum litorale TaxID=2056700 RepID=A0A8J2Z455_9GAMM|nr:MULTISPECIES: hypothetical protein [Cysteiniphilum]GGF96710.1 hypothetical protein GCM10010995_12450 [Cysteiniphilum litorale]